MKKSRTEFDISEDLKCEEHLRRFYISGKQKLQTGDTEGAYQDFLKSENILGCAYCRFLQGKLKETLELLNQIKDLNPAVNWLLFLCGIIKEDIKETPTYFQIRNFYENDINMLILCKNIDYAMKICSKSEYLARYNKEIFKYTARVLIDNGSINKSIYFLKKSIDICYKDPEAHFMLAEVYKSMGDIQNAEKEYNTSNSVAGGYYPAIKKLKELKPI